MRIYPERAYNFIDRTGQRFGRLTVIRLGEKIKGSKLSQWVCRCDCGIEKTVQGGHLQQGHTLSCGCYARQRTSEARKTHGESRHGHSPEYTVWLSMKARCLYKSMDSYYLYGGRGITVCKRWMNSFENFLADMGRRPSMEHSIERLDGNKNYEPGNCKWATRIEQANNKRNNRKITFDGVTMNLFQWARKVGLSPVRLHARLKTWSVERALTEPLNHG